MKTTIYTFLFFAATILTEPGYASDFQQPLTHEHLIWNYAASNWEKDGAYQYSYTYTASGGLLSELVKYRSVSSMPFENNSRTTHTLNGFDKPSISLFELWNTSSSNWDKTNQKTYQYDVNNNQTEELIQIWISGTSTWRNSHRTLWTYTNHVMVTEVGQAWDYNNNIWIDVNRTVNTVNGTTYMIDETVKADWNSTTSTWDNTEKITYTYDANHNPTEIIGLNWYTSAWVNQGRTVYNYNAFHKLSSDIYYSWNSVAWQNYQHDSCNYNGSNQLTYSSTELWNSTYHRFENFTRNTITPDANGNTLTDIQEDWYNSSWNNASKDTYTYGTFNGIASSSITELTAAAYPNPCRNSFVCSFALDRAANVSMQVQDITGKTIMEVNHGRMPEGGQHLELSTDRLPSGLYFYSITAGGNRYSGKIVKE